MGLFGGKDEKADRKTTEMLSRFGLENLDSKDRNSVEKIMRALMGNKLIETGMALQGKGEESAKLSYLRALVEQNWIIIRQLDSLINNR